MNWDGRYFVTLELHDGSVRRVDASQPLPKGGCSILAVDNGLDEDSGVKNCYSVASSRGYPYVDNDTDVRVKDEKVVMGAFVKRAEDRGREGAERLWVGYDHERRAYVVEKD